ncbi:hypothetical protein [Dyella sp. GSA-30]|uniref:hypothetical protein n=1 Tax=Dyella sp. GSA-30 TaxID=2994496 RepID=UPI002493CF8F|nr:hypothetical protein [Dyella sp. GSA-30]BDU22046.1 hypothetical protein DYGSA30_35030 [Dyella sp. GSA-30]
MNNLGLNLPLRPGLLTSIDQDFGDEHYVVHRENPAFDFFWHMALSVSAMTIAISSINKLTVSKGDYIGLSGVGFDYTVRIPAHGSVEDVLSGQKILGMVITLHFGKDQSAQAGWPEELKRWMEMVLWPGFVHLFETHETSISKRGGDAGRLARILRDAYAHGGKIANKKSGLESSWHGVSITKANNGDPVSEFVGGSDLIVLALKLCSVIA